jgi:hypothetical protein
LGTGWYNDLRGEFVNQEILAKKKRQASRLSPRLTAVDARISQLRRVERHIDGLFRQVIDGLSDEELSRSSRQFDVLVSEFPDLRLDSLDRHAHKARALLTHLDPECGPLPGFREAMACLCRACVTTQAIHGLRSRLYTVAARVAESSPALLPAVALASISLKTLDPAQNPFIEMVVCASAMEWAAFSDLGPRGPPLLDVSTWLAAQPSAALVAAVGEGQAYRYAPIPGVFSLLDHRRILFEPRRLAQSARAPFRAGSLLDRHVLDELVDRQYDALLRAEIERVQEALRRRHPSNAIADLVMMTGRALEALDELPPDVNPLLQAIFVQSWVRYLHETL